MMTIGCGYKDTIVTLTQFSGVVMDMDGVLWRGDELLPGVTRWFALLQQQQIPFVLATNNSAKTPADYVHKLERLSIGGVTERQIITSGTTTVDYLQRHYARGTAVHVLGGDGLRALVAGAGFTLADSAHVVVVGIDTHLTYDKLKRAALLLRAGADFIGTNDDRSIPTPEGLAPGAGSILAALRAATDREPLVMGKPHAPMFETALTLLGCPPERTLMIGDRLDTDIAGAHAAGLQTALVLTGVATRADVAASRVQPDNVYVDLAAMTTAFTTNPS
jgi:4-nitrophenyl phosphatase